MHPAPSGGKALARQGARRYNPELMTTLPTTPGNAVITFQTCRRLRRAAGLGLLALTLAALLATPPARAETLNRIVLVVNDQIATLFDYQQRLGQQLAALNRSELDPEERRRQLERLPRELFREMLDELLILSRAEQLGIRVGDAELERLMEQVRAANDFESVDELRRAVAQSGQPWERFQAELAKTARFRELISREVYGRIALEEDDLRRFYRDNPDLFQEPEQMRLREIVVLDSSGLSLGEMERLAREVRQRLVAGEEPSSVVQNDSEPPRTSGVIELDWVPMGDLDPSLRTAAAELSAGEWSQPVPARGGLHLVQLLERKEARMRPFDEVQDEIYAREQDRLFQLEYPKYLRELEAQSHVVVEPPPEAQGFRRRADEPAPTSDPLELFRRKPGEEGAAAAQPEPESGGADSEPPR